MKKYLFITMLIALFAMACGNADHDGSGIQYCVYTSYVQTPTVYTSGDIEIFDDKDLTTKGSFAGPTFYTANRITTSERLIFEDDPRAGGALTLDSAINRTTDVTVSPWSKQQYSYPIYVCVRDPGRLG